MDSPCLGRVSARPDFPEPDPRNAFIEQIARMAPYPNPNADPDDAEQALNSLIATARLMVAAGRTDESQ